MQAEIRCRKCGNTKFTLRYCELDGVKSIIADCECGRVVEYRGFQIAVMVNGV